jgi:hypothetical protein
MTTASTKAKTDRADKARRVAELQRLRDARRQQAQLLLRIDPAIAHAVRAAAELESRNISNYVAEAVTHHMQDTRKMTEFAFAAEVLNCPLLDSQKALLRGCAYCDGAICAESEDWRRPVCPAHYPSHK